MTQPVTAQPVTAQPVTAQPVTAQPVTAQAMEEAPEWAALPGLSWRELLLLLLGRRSRFQITGRSMLPLLRPGDEVLVDLKAYGEEPPQPGDIALARHPLQPQQKIVKQVVAVEGDRYLLRGKNAAESTDSRSFGWVEKELLLGKVVCQFRA